TSSLLLSELWYADAEQFAPISLADLDLDGALDLLVIQDDELLLHHELPDRSWSEYARFTVPERVVSLVVRDINADGKPDLVLGDATPALTAAIAGPDSSFTLGPTNLLTATPSQLHSPATAATAFIATTHDPDPLVTALRLDPTGLLVEQTPLPIAGDAYGLSSADIDADGDADLVLLTLSGPELVTSLVIVPADADGWGSPQTRELSALLPDTDFNNATLALGDLDLDGTIDAAILTSSAIVRLMNIGAALPPPPRVDPFVNNGGTLGTAVIAEVDGTGRPDIVQCAYLGLQIVLTTSDGELQPQAQLERIATSCAFHVDPNDLSLRVAAGDGDLSVFEPAFAPALTTLGEFNGGPKPLRRLELGDLDADGHLDIVVADEGSSGMESVDSTSSFAVLWGAADSLPTRATWQAGRDYQTAEIALAPLDDRPGDELVVAWSQGQVDIWTHQDGALALLRTLPTDFTDLSAVAIQRHPRSPSNIILLGHLAPDQWTVAATDLATGALTPLWIADSNDEPALLTVADLDHDGHDDLAVIPRSFAPVQLLWGGPERTTLGPTIELLPAVASLHAADMDGDGTPELVLASEAGVLAHDLHTRVVGEPVVHVASSALQGLLLADLEGDGRADILRTSDHDLNLTLRAPTGDDRVQLTFNPTWSVLRAAHLDDDEILDLIGLRNGAVTSRLSAPQ
ncbi:MAG: hypothetical protein JNK56_03590, partial [Myxococcales bacterium]|nr:hypothetical protein [Myxococcales bacterium]